MSHPDLTTLLRHRPPALQLGAIVTRAADRLACASRRDDAWQWPELLEGAAQAAGLLAGFQRDGIGNTAVVAEYRRVVIHAAAHHGPVRFEAALDRRILGCWRCRLAARAADGRVLLQGLVTIAPPGDRPR